MTPSIAPPELPVIAEGTPIAPQMPIGTFPGLLANPSGLKPMVMQPVLPQNFQPGDKLPDAFGEFPPKDSEGNAGNVFPLPAWILNDMDSKQWQAQQFLGNYTIYLLGDLSTRYGLDDILAWNWTLRQLITNQYAAWPPNMVTIVSPLEDPYAYNDLRIVNTMKYYQNQENMFGMIAMDRDGQFARALGYADLPQPIVVFVDSNGYIRMVLVGRVRDISSGNIDQAMSVIADMWQWDQKDKSMLPIFQGIINLLKNEAYDPAQRDAPPPDTARTMAPTWGYPSLVPQATTPQTTTPQTPGQAQTQGH